LDRELSDEMSNPRRLLLNLGWIENKICILSKQIGGFVMYRQG
jgi:hypothetical protein